MTKYEEKLIRNANYYRNKIQIIKAFRNRKKHTLDTTRKVDMI